MRRYFAIHFFLLATLFSFGEKAFAQHGETNTAVALSIKKLEVATGLKVDLFATEPLLQNPVAFSIDERGRFFISETHRYKTSIFDITRETNWLQSDLSFRTVEDRGAFLQKEFTTNITFLTKDSELIRLVEDRDGDGHAETSSVFAEGFNQTVSGTAAGILATKGDVWFTCVPDLWKITSDKLQTTNQSLLVRRSPIVNRQSIANGFGVHIGVSGHDLHGLIMGPDGKIYFSSGDRGFSVHTKEGKFLNYPDTGGVLRCNPDGSDLEVFCYGLRNPQELAFDQYGNLFTDDNDTAGEDKSRLLYLVEGGDYGWRASYQFMEGYGPWIQENNWLGGIDCTLPPAGEVAQGPSGLAFYPGTGLPEKYQNHLFACDFPKGVWSFAVKQRGAGYQVFDKEKFLWNLGATDIAFGPDGAAYVSDWGQSYTMPDNGKIFRVFDPTQQGTTLQQEVKKLLAEGMEKRSSDELEKLLGHPDLRVRTEAQFELVRQRKTDALIQVALKSQNELSRLHAIWGFGQLLKQFASLNSELEKSILNAFPHLLSDSNSEIRAQSAKALGDSHYYITNFRQNLVSLLSDTNSRVRFFAAASLAKANSKEIIPALLQMLKENADHDPYLVHAGFWALVSIGDFEAIQSAAKNENISIRRAALLAMRRMERPEIAQFLNDAEPKLIVEAARAINDVPINAAMPELASRLGKTSDSTAFHLRAINANFRLGENSNAVTLAKFAVNETAPEMMRANALDSLSAWENPSQIDRIMGLWRPISKRDAAPAIKAYQSIGTQLFQSGSEKILVAATRCARKLKLNEPALFSLFKNNQSIALRIEILQTLSELKSDKLTEVVELSLADKNDELRREGIKFTAQVSPEKAPLLLENLLSGKSDFRLKQASLSALGNLTNAAATEALNRQLDLLLEGKIIPELQLDLLSAVEKKNDDRFAIKINRFKTKFPKPDFLLDFQPTLFGGDAARGKKIFNEREDVACLRCHAIKGKGGTVGPDLAGISSRQTREYLLEAVVLPNKSIAPGFENIAVRMKNGDSHAGMVKTETDTTLVLNSPEDGVITLKKSEVEKRDNAFSSMPEGLGTILNKADLRDLIEFLSTLK